MADNFTFPGNTSVYVPTLHADLVVEFSRNPNKFPIVRYTNTRKVDKQRGYYLQFRNDDQVRDLGDAHYVWPDGNDSPAGEESSQYDFPQFNCRRYAYNSRVGYLAVEQAGWDILGQLSRFRTMQGMTNRSKRVATTISTNTNYPVANRFAAVADGGATWGNATSSAPSIRKTIMKAANQIQQATNGAIMLQDLYLIINPNQAVVIATSQEWIDFIKQSPDSLNVWRGSQQFNTYNIPDNIFGISVVVDDTVVNANQANTDASRTYTFPDSTAVLVTKQQAISPAGSSGVSTFELFAYSEWETFVYNDVKNRRYLLQVVENVDDSFLFAPTSGAYIATNS